jgi:uncharacterized protein YndB with AHSA1/START domain
MRFDMLKRMAGGIVVILVGLAGYVATRPAGFRVSRSRLVAAPPEIVHGYVSDFHTWPQWSPWEGRDPAMRRELSGAPKGTGAVYWWSGNAQVGEGRMTITDSRAPARVTMRLDFVKPWAATNTVEFAFAPSGSGTSVTWTMTGEKNFIAKAFSLVKDVEGMVGPDFEKGLANLDAATAAAAARHDEGSRS